MKSETTKITSKAWYAKFPLDAYAIGPFRFENPITELAFRKHLRKWEGCKRLIGVQIWVTS